MRYPQHAELVLLLPAIYLVTLDEGLGTVLALPFAGLQQKRPNSKTNSHQIWNCLCEKAARHREVLDCHTK